MTWVGQQSMDPNDIAAKYATEDGLAFLGSIFTDPDEDSLKVIEKIREIMDALPPVEADFIDLYFFRQLKQIDIATIFGVSQPTVCYRLQRAATRIKFLLDMPFVDTSKMRLDISGFLSDPIDVNILMLMFDTTCQSEVAKRLGVTQGFVRHRFVRSINRMMNCETMAAYATLFSLIAENLNVLREVRKPTRVCCVLD